MTEQKIKGSEEKYRQIIKHLDLGYFKTDINGIILEHNPAVNKILGFELDESLVGLSAKDFFGSIKEYNKFQKEMTKKGRLRSFIHSARNKNGETIFLQAHSHIYKNKEKNRLEVEGTVFDVTEKFVLEQKLKESEQKYRNIIENSKDAIVIIGLDAKFKYISPQLSKMVGKEYNVETQLLTDVNPDDIDYLKDILSYAIKNRDVGAFGDFEFRALHHDGHYIWFSCSAKNYYDEDGTVIGFIILVRDVTDKKEAEQKLKESEEKHRGILDKLEQGYYEVDLKGNYTFVNKFHANYFGYSKDEFIGKNYRNFFDEETGKRIFKTYNEIYRKNLPKGIIELETVRPDGVRHIFEASIYLKRDSNGKKIGFYGTTYDISERKEAELRIKQSEEELRNLNIELEEKVRDRTKELEEKNIELKKLDQAKDDFITMAAHELKTPLISVAGYTDYILTKYIDELSVDVKNDLLIVQRNIDRLQTLMNQLLDVMKIESHKIKLNLELTNVSNIIYRCLHELNYLFKEKDHEMVLNIDNEIFINIDPNRIFQVFSNLISNSTKFTPKGGKIEISAKKDVMHYLFEVKDNGIGLPEEDLDRIFKKFERVKNDDESFQTGSGLGLYISKGFVEAHGGQIWATSEGLNKGMTIHFTIPT
ncbi:MAG: PAS domain S-box protein [Candidatus Hodarchaeota archaeon]